MGLVQVGGNNAKFNPLMKKKTRHNHKNYLSLQLAGIKHVVFEPDFLAGSSCKLSFVSIHSQKILLFKSVIGPFTGSPNVVDFLLGSCRCQAVSVRQLANSTQCRLETRRKWRKFFNDARQVRIHILQMRSQDLRIKHFAQDFLLLTTTHLCSEKVFFFSKLSFVLLEIKTQT